MKKLLGFILLLFLVQSEAFSQKGTVWSGFDTQLSKYGSNYKFVEVAYKLGYNFTDKLYANLRIEDAMMFVNEDDVRYNSNNCTLGVNVGYELFRQEEMHVDARIGAGSTILNKDWKYMYYDGCLLLTRTYDKVTPSVGFGARYYDSYNGMFKNRFRAYVIMGFAIAM